MRKRPHSGRLAWPAPVSGQQLQAFLSLGRGFWTPVSARFFPISVSGERRLVRELAETSSKNANGVGGSDVEAGQQPRFYFGGLDTGSREAVGRIASNHRILRIRGTGVIASTVDGAQSSAPARPTNRARLWRGR